MKTIAISTLFFVLFSGMAFAGGPNPLAATEITQMFNNLELVEIAISAAAQYLETEAIRRLSDKNSKKVPLYHWADSMAALQDLGNAVNQGQALAYSAASISEEFGRRFKGYNSYQNQNTSYNPSDFTYKYSQWIQTNTDTIRGVMQAANLQYDNFRSESRMMRRLASMGTSSIGQMQALEVGNQIGSHMVGQLQTLKSLMMAQMQMQSAYYMMQTDKFAFEKGHDQNLSQEYQETIIDDGAEF